MKAVMLALMGTLIGGGVGTGGGALLLARCESTDAEQHAPEGTEADTLAVPEEGTVDAEGPDTVGALGPLPDHTGGEAEASGVEEALPDAEPEPEAAVDVGADAGTEAEEAGADAPPPGAVDPAAPAVEPIVLAPTPDPTALRRLARIFSNMKAEQAAAVMVELTDAEAQRILVSMSERAAAAILGKMDSSRAAVLSQRVLGGGGGES